uniref:Glucosylceramidase n=1 Tax=Alexandrium monilatum TaxID=311494 RepID=A0A7S4SP86_9DINO
MAPAGEAAREAAVPLLAEAPRPAVEALEVPENQQLVDLVGAVVELHLRGREVVDEAAGVQTSYVPLAARNVPAELVLSRLHVLGLMGIVEIAGLTFLVLSMTAGFAADLGIMFLCALVGATGIAIHLASSRTRCTNSQAVRALHAVARVRQDAVPLLWREAAAWASRVPAGYQRSLAWRSQVAFLVEVDSRDSSRHQAFVLEPCPLRVHHYIVRPDATAASAAEAAWALRAFLGRAEVGNGIVAEDRPPCGVEGKSVAPVRKYSKVRVVLSRREGDSKLTELPTLAFQEGPVGMSQDASVFVSPANRVSKPWLGFGGSFTESAAAVFAKMSQEHQQQVLHAYFDPYVGAGYTIGRMSMGSCDFGLGNWTCGDLKDEDHELTAFSIEHYMQEIIPLYKRSAQVAGRPLWMLASPWSPPPWMKTKRQFNGDAHLRPDCGKAWARHFVRFVQAMAEAKVPIMAVSVQNEPEAAQIWEACIYTAEEERAFVRDHLGPALSEADLSSVKILIWDHNRDGMFERAQRAYSDPEAAKYIWGCAYHWYGDARFEAWPDRSEVYFPDRQQNWQLRFELKSRLGLENLKRVAELHPDKHILFTEGCQELSGVPLKAIQNEWMFGERYAMNIIADMNNGCEGWIDWNLFLDEQGGPNHVDNNCLAPIIYDTQKQEVIYTPPYLFLSHFSRFIRPEARRILCSTSRDALEVTSFMNVDGSIVVVVLNRSSSEVDFKLKVAGEGADPVQAVQLTSPPSSIMTLVVE